MVGRGQKIGSVEFSKSGVLGSREVRLCPIYLCFRSQNDRVFRENRRKKYQETG